MCVGRKLSRDDNGHETSVLKWNVVVQDWQRKEKQALISWDKGIHVPQIMLSYLEMAEIFQELVV